MLTLADYAHHALAQHSRKVGKHAHTLKDANHPDQPEAIHQIRVGLRRLRTALEVFGFALDLPDALSIKRVKKFAASLGQVRDLDVLHQHLQVDLRPSLPPVEVEILEQTLLPKLQRQRAKLWQEAQKLLNSDKYARFDQVVQTWLAQPQYQPIGQFPMLAVAPDLLLPLVSRLLLHPGWLIELPQTLDDWDALHDLRKQIKRTRYQMELCQDLYPSDYAQQVKVWAQLQDLLGLVQDQVVLASWLDKTLKQPLNQTLPILADQLWVQTQALWQEWQPLRQPYTDLQHRSHLRSLCLQPTEPELTSLEL